MAKEWICTICGYVAEGEEAPAKCPQCGAPASKFKELDQKALLQFVTEHEIGVAKGCDEEMIKDLNNHFTGECTEVGMYLAMSRQADREGYPEVAEAFKRYAWEEAEHAELSWLSSSATWYGIPRLTLRSVCTQRLVQMLTRCVSLRTLRLRTLTLSTTQFMRWLRMRLATVRALPVFTTAISASKYIKHISLDISSTLELNIMHKIYCA